MIREGPIEGEGSCRWWRVLWVVEGPVKGGGPMGDGGDPWLSMDPLRDCKAGLIGN